MRFSACPQKVHIQQQHMTICKEQKYVGSEVQITSRQEDKEGFMENMIFEVDLQ